MKKTILHLAFFLLSLFGIFFAGCAGKEIDQSNPQAIYEDAEQDIKDERYQMALDKLKTVKNKFPYSNYSKLALLKIADVSFLDEDFIAAAASYETFRDLHPKHEKADYVLFRIGESYFFQLPSTIDRDLTPASKAIDSYRELQTLYPKSEFIPESQKHQKESFELLSQKEKYIGDFYFKRDMFDSASKRFEKIATKYPNTGAEEYAYYKWGQSLIEQSNLPEFSDKRSALRAEARHVFKTYMSRFPSGSYSSRIESLTKGAED